MRRCIGLALLAAFVASSAPAWAATDAFEPKVTDLTVFKDGHALVMAKGTATLADGWCRTRDVPAPVLGTFWAFVADDKAQVDLVKAGFVDVAETRPCLTLDEILQANVGKAVVLAVNDGTMAEHKGTLRGILQHKAATETTATRTTPARYDRYSGHRPAVHTPETREAEATRLASFVMLETDGGLKLIQRAHIRGVTLVDKQPATTTSTTERKREIALHVVRDGKALAGKHTVGMVYVQRGVRWIPSYRVELLDGGKARLSLRGTIVNEMADLDNVNLRLVVGVPSFIMKDTLSPMALRDAGLQLSSFFRPPAPHSGRPDMLYLSNAMMSQVAMPAAPRSAPAPGGPDIPSEGQMEDLFLYHRDGVSLKKGESAVVHLMDVVVAYEDIYKWDVPAVPPQDLWRHVGSSQRQELARALHQTKLMHNVRLTNTGSTPWTTGPATIFKGGTVLGQHLLTFTSIKNKVDLPITVAVNLNVRKAEVEVDRKLNALNFGGSRYAKVSMKGSLSIINFKDRDVRIVVTRGLLGSVTKASHDGSIRRGNTAEGAHLDARAYPWYAWGWPWWWLHLNPLTEVSWEHTLAKGKTLELEYDYYYYHQH